MNHSKIKAAIKWTVDAAREHVELCAHTGETPDPDPCMGLWQSFQAEFPKTDGESYDELVTVWFATYSATVSAMAAAA